MSCKQYFSREKGRAQEQKPPDKLYNFCFVIRKLTFGHFLS
ncbi:hypothetical protein FAEPRAA2165_03077 [Faecalibacterium duncaniae]|uniref:Uncharacterized protein n=1 Tax=Faecalibacterium duncaniae (strain DSM 17677 / JCM 31915 / A2-165) TaxID=411483 RepID=C7H9S3_FAED2|nr:hypothetical protein FAEPRAA2165_03077 [Faecalibacterium duncaniae]